MSLTIDIKRTLHYKLTTHRESADGYTDKLTIKNEDPKEFFHWTPQIAQTYV